MFHDDFFYQLEKWIKQLDRHCKIYSANVSWADAAKNRLPYRISRVNGEFKFS